MTTKRIPELDGLRGAAILLVVLVHYFSFSPYANGLANGRFGGICVAVSRTISMGWTGVDLFFVLSGFLIGGILLDVRSSPRYFKTFYLRRFFRIIPLYYGWIFAYIVVMAVAGSFLRTHVAGGAEPDGRHQYIVLGLFLQNFGLLGSSVVAGKWFVPTWSVAVEEQFYLIAPALIRILSRRALYGFLFLVVCAAPLLRIAVQRRFPVPSGRLDFAYLLMPCRADAFAIGIFAALLWRNERFRRWIAASPQMLYGLFSVSFAGFAALAHWYPEYNSRQMISVGYTWIAGFYALMLIIAIGRTSEPIARVMRIGWLSELGRISYCFYLIHLAVRLIGQILVRAAVGEPGAVENVLISVAAVVVSYALASASWMYYENPLLRRGRAYHY